MKIILDIKENKVDFVLELLKSFTFVKTESLSPEKAKRIKGLKQAINDVKLHKEGKIKLKTARQFLNEL